MTEQNPNAAPAQSAGDIFMAQVNAARSRGLVAKKTGTTSNGPFSREQMGAIIAAQIRRDRGEGRANSKVMINETLNQGQGNYWAKVGSGGIFAEYFKTGDGRITWTGQAPIEYEDCTAEDIQEGEKYTLGLMRLHGLLPAEAPVVPPTTPPIEVEGQ